MQSILTIMTPERYLDDMGTMVNQGLEGVVAAKTALSMVDGERGELIIAGYPVAELALNATFEETVSLLWNDPVDFASRRALPQSTLELLA
jgi:citrate synthase